MRLSAWADANGLLRFSLLTPHASRLTPHASRLTPRASRLAPRASPLAPRPMDDLRYPVGKLQRPPSLTDAQRRVAIDEIASTPQKFRAAVKGLTESQLDTPYRPDCWTVRHLLHHVPDSHMNAYIRFKLALTEDNPTIKPYAEDRWANLEDSRSTPI